MRDLEAQRLREKKEWETIPESHDELVDLKRKIHGSQSPLSQEITLSQLVYLVSKELSKPVRKSGGILTHFVIFLMTCSLFASLFQAFRMLRGNDLITMNPSGYDIENDVLKFRHIKYFGQRKRLDYFVWTFERMFFAYDSFDDEKLLREYKPTNRNIILYGPPGTGKTLFVKVFAYLLEISLRVKIFKELNASTNIHIGGSSSTQTVIGNNHNATSSPVVVRKRISLKDLSKIDPQVCLISVRPSSFVSKYVGETEKNLDNLFNFAYKLSENKVVIIFFDEIESVSRKRTDSTPDHALNAISQFLNILDGPSTPLRKKVLLIGATNSVDMIDPAIFRRFYFKIKMMNPSSQQRDYMIRRLSEVFVHIEDNNHQKLVDLTDGMSFDAIDKAFSDLKRRSSGPPYFINYDDIIGAVENQKKLTSSADETSDFGDFHPEYDDFDIDLPHRI